MSKAAQRTKKGSYFVGDCESLLKGALGKELKGKVQLILTSPPYPLNRKKNYGNLTGASYRKWLVGLAPTFAELLRPDGSIIIEIGNSWVQGRPVQSLLHLESLLGFVRHRKAGLRLCQQFVCYNPARLPSPAAWVTIKKIRATDSYTHVWWLSTSDFPKAHTSRVQRPYSQGMKNLLKRGSYNEGARPSEHDISAAGFLKKRSGSLPRNVLELEPMSGEDDYRVPNALRIANTGSNDFFLRTCREREVTPHPARMPAGLASFFIKMLTDPDDLVLDPFAGSNTTGFVAELANRRWIGIDAERKYVEQSKIRFGDPVLKKKNLTRS